MKHLFTGVAVAAALAIAAPVWAQNPSGGNGMGMPGPNPGGGGGLTPYSGGGPAPAAAAAPAENSAMPPAHHAVRHAHAMHGFHKGMAHKAALTGDTTAQLNREELARLQSGAPPSPPMAAAPPMSNPSGGNSMGMPGPNAGGPGLSPYSSGAGGGGLGR
jgi:hypothetical protein